MVILLLSFNGSKVSYYFYLFILFITFPIFTKIQFLVNIRPNMIYKRIMLTNVVVAVFLKWLILKIIQTGPHTHTTHNTHKMTSFRKVSSSDASFKLFPKSSMILRHKPALKPE